MLEQIRPLTAGLRQIADSILELLPSLIGVVLLLLVGWIVARLLRALTLRSAHTLNRGAQAIGLGSFARSLDAQGSPARALDSTI